MTLTIQRYFFTGILKIDTIIVEIPISIVMVKVFLVLGFPDPELKSVGKKSNLTMQLKTLIMIGRHICLSN